VKTIRLCLLMLLAVLLPIRGAVAAAMMCPPAASGGHHAMHGAGEHAEHPLEHAHGHADAHPHEHAPGAAHDHHAAGDQCGLCAACCTAAPLLSSVPHLSLPDDLRTAAFPALPARAPSFVSDGPERPPRRS